MLFIYFLLKQLSRFVIFTKLTADVVFSQDQVSYLTGEYEDAVQRARRLSASREKMLTGRGNPANLLTQDDVLIYLHWLVCHLRSAQTINNFLRVEKSTLLKHLFGIYNYAMFNN